MYKLEGCQRLVFDGYCWERAGGDIGNNSCFRKPATVVKVYNKRGDWLADVVFNEGNELSRGHVVSGLRELRMTDD